MSSEPSNEQNLSAVKPEFQAPQTDIPETTDVQPSVDSPDVTQADSVTSASNSAPDHSYLAQSNTQNDGYNAPTQDAASLDEASLSQTTSQNTQAAQGNYGGYQPSAAQPYAGQQDYAQQGQYGQPQQYGQQYYGQQQAGYYAQPGANGSTVINVNNPAGATQPVNGIGIAGFVVSLCAWVFSWVPVLNWIVWLVGAVLSIIGCFKQPKGLAIAGVAISFIGLIVILVFLAFLGSLFMLG